MENRKGFTLVEVLVVIAIIGILALLILPNFISTFRGASDKAMITQENEIVDATKLFIEDVCRHPLEKFQKQLSKKTNVDSLRLFKVKENIENGEKPEFNDGQFVKFGGIITEIKKKYTKNNTQMAFVTIEDLYGSIEVIVFENCLEKAINNLIVDNIVIVDGRVSIKEEEEPKIVARDILGLELENQKSLKLNIINADEETKAKLRGALKFFSGEKNNLPVYVITETGEKECGSIYCNKQILEQFEEILGKENVRIN